MVLFKKEKEEKLGFNLQDRDNQRALIKAALDNKVMLVSKGEGVYLVDTRTRRLKDDTLLSFLKQFLAASMNCKQSIIYREDPKADYIIVYDKKED